MSGKKKLGSALIKLSSRKVDLFRLPRRRDKAGRWRIEHTASSVLNRQRRQTGLSSFAADK
ncbi:MAG: hypothetical protein FWG01_04610, partial [Betaproteobacteria bacterium]|nr:hypothetical protein [Betaproteobacteria bacterium]